jgi:hypothetical protein
VRVKQASVTGLALTPFILQKSRMRRRARTDLCGGAISDGRPYREMYDIANTDAQCRNNRYLRLTGYFETW